MSFAFEGHLQTWHLKGVAAVSRVFLPACGAAKPAMVFSLGQMTKPLTPGNHAVPQNGDSLRCADWLFGLDIAW